MQDTFASSRRDSFRSSPLGRLSEPELETRIALLDRASERFPEMRDAIFLERSRLERVLAEKHAPKKPTRPVEVAE